LSNRHSMNSPINPSATPHGLELSTICSVVAARIITLLYDLSPTNGFELFFDVGRIKSPMMKKRISNRFAEAAHRYWKNFLDGGTQMSMPPAPSEERIR
jgi:hypothetical protein